MALPGWAMMVLGVCTHLVFLASIFDIYFKSPLVDQLEPQYVLSSSPAHRLVLISADGLRADKLFSNSSDGHQDAPFINSMGRGVGVWGVSHTRVPTESRPGHVAMVAGVYEDPSAVTRGWKENPVDFDTIFNRSTHTWAWGSPDIVPMLARGASVGKVDYYVYDAEEQQVQRSRTSVLDQWVFERVSRTLKLAAVNSTFFQQISRPGCVFFLHLLGLDTAGHAFKPDSRQYTDNIHFVDDGLRSIVAEFDTVFNDNRTVYMFTSDHGMTSWGSHGAGDPSETETPLVMWGAGVRGPDTSPVSVHQVDLSPLMASLIGVGLPVNSMGRVPVDLLSSGPAFRADVLFTNARQLLYQLERRRNQRQQQASWLHWPFTRLTQQSQKRLIDSVLDYMARKQWQAAMFLSGELVDLALAGIDYYVTYDRIFLNVLITLCYIFWILLLVARLARRWDAGLNYVGERSSAVFSIVVAVLGSLLATLIMIFRSFPVHYMVYLYTPVLLLACVAYEWRGLAPLFGVLLHGRPLRWLLLAIGVEALVLVFFWRRLLSVMLLILAPWPLLVPAWGRRRYALCLYWALMCVLLAYFPMSPIVTHRAEYDIVKIAGVFSFAVFLFASLSSELRLLLPVSALRERAVARVVLVVQLMALLLASVLVHLLHLRVKSGEPVPLPVQRCAWLILVLGFVLPCFTSTWLLNRLLHLSLALVASSLLFSLGREAFFCPLLSMLLLAWLRLEHRDDQKHMSCLSFEDPMRRRESIRPSVYGDARRSFLFLFFVLLAFFGVGNLDSINSFNPNCVFMFVSVFNPWLMGFLLLVKTLLPFLLVCCFARAVSCVTRMSAENVFFSLLLMLDVMSVHFFYLVTDQGSWLQIGKSISHHVIVVVTAVFLLVLHQLARVVTSCHIPLPSLRLSSTPMVTVGSLKVE